MRSKAKGRRGPEREGTAWRRSDLTGLRLFLSDIASRHPVPEQLAIVCIGTDRSTGDSYGPWVGTLLAERGWNNVIGTIAAPCDADRYGSLIAALPPGKVVIAIDAGLGKPESVGGYLVADGPLHPARATGGYLAPVGDYSIGGIVGPLSAKPYWSLQRASLHQVIRMARDTADAIHQAWAPHSAGEMSAEAENPSITHLVRFIIEPGR
ncbi:DUF1256 domain-containing protein [Paenibacillus methanolicus]|uniref:Putative sporulation protein YyaC n=1 Tax=Paenibacillus methanolicus TaxID=582686 RepID=A0A5S5BVH6_9BACL|nr:DUF1256 domain-containing protein [Paenibacillus methanolicus]TYP70318.1 putative sporulation protein YyaC [Paenibacillus methanolicus]